MAVVGYAPRAVADLERLCDFLAKREPHAASATIELIAGAVDVLAAHPQIGRPVESGLRELVISRGKSGYVALYRYDEARDRVLVLATRHQREAGFDE